MARRSPDAITRDRLSFAADVELDALYRPFARAVVASVRKHAVTGQPLDYPFRSRVLSDVDEALIPAFGRFNGDENAGLSRLVVRQARAMRAAVFAGAMARVRRLLRGQGDIMAAIEEAS